MRQYLERRAKTPDRADAQLKLAVWCEQNGLQQQATAHFHQVLRLDPSREIARKHLGFKKVGGHWIKPEKVALQKQEVENQKKANKHWQPLLEKYRDGLVSKDKSRRASAEKGLAEVTDPSCRPRRLGHFRQRGIRHGRRSRSPCWDRSIRQEHRGRWRCWRS